MSDSPTTTKRPGRLKRLTRWLLIILITVTVVLAGGYFYVFSPGNLKSLTSGVLASYLGGEIEMDSASLSLRTYRLKLYNPRLLAHDLPDECAEVFRAERIIIHLDREAIWRGSVVPTEIVIYKPTVCLTQVAPTGRMNLQHLRFIETHEKEDEDYVPPRIVVLDGTFQNGMREGDTVRPVGTLDFAGAFEPLPDNPSVYSLRMFEAEDNQPKPGGLNLTGRFDLETDDILMSVQQLEFTERYQDLLPVAVSEMWQMMAPEGQLPTVEFAYENDRGWQATVSVDGVSFDLPQLTDDPYRVRFNDVCGAFVFDNQGVHIQDTLSGTVEGLPYEITGGYNGYSVQAPFRLSLVTEAFVIPEQPRFIYALPQPVQEAFEVIRPSGTMRATLMISRDDPEGEIDYEGLATLIDAKCVPEQFPYPLTQCRGQISFDREQVKIRSFSAKTSGDGNALIYGRIWPPGPTGNVDLVVTATNVPFDETLFKAFDADVRPIFDSLFHTESYDRLRKRGHFISASDFNAMDYRAGRVESQLRSLPVGDPKAAELKAELATLDQLLQVPAFDLGGLATVNVQIKREAGEGDRTQATAEIILHDANIIFDDFAYPFHVTDGRVRVEPEGVYIDELDIEGLRGGNGRMSGQVLESIDPQGDFFYRPNVEVAAFSLPIDKMLLDALPEEEAEILNKLNLTGRLSLSGRIWKDAQRVTDMLLNVEVSQAAAQPGDGSFPLTGLHGQIELTLNGMHINGLHAKHPAGDATIVGSGDWSDPDNEKFTIIGKLTNLRFEAPPLGAMRDFIEADTSWTEFLAEHKITGSFDSEMVYKLEGDRSTHNVTIHPHDIEFLHADRTVRLNDMSGRMLVDGDQLKLTDFGGMIAGGGIYTSGTVELDDTQAAKLTMRAKGDRITEDLKHALPVTVSDLLETLEMEGRYNVDLERVNLFPNATHGQLSSDVQGTVEVEQGSCSLGVDITRFNGSFEIEATDVIGQPMANLRVDMHGRSLEISDRQVTDLRGQLQSVPGTSQLVVPQLRGTCTAASSAVDARSTWTRAPTR